MTALLCYLLLFSCLSLALSLSRVCVCVCVWACEWVSEWVSETRTLSLIRSSQKHSHTADRPKACCWQTGNLMDWQRSHLENRSCILSSCLAITQLYMADTIEQRGGLDWRPQKQVFVFAQGWFIVVPQIVNSVLVLFLQKVSTLVQHVISYDRWSSCGFLVCLLYIDLLACLCWFRLAFNSH